MKTITYIIIGFLLFACTSKECESGKLILVEYQPVYEEDNTYFPHDYFVEVGTYGTALSIEKDNNYLKITNVFNGGLSGHRIEFTISKNLNIKKVKYDRWLDVIDGSETKYVVEKAILSINTNPFESSQIVGYYTLQIRKEFSAGKILKKEGVNDTVTFDIFNGKFKVYSELEKEKGRDWVISQNEILMGIKDSLDVYYTPDKYAKFIGDISILKQFEIERSKTKLEKLKHVLLEMIIDEEGKVIPESMTVEDMKSDELIRNLQKCESLLSNWQPAIYKDKPVKSKVNLPIPIKD